MTPDEAAILATVCDVAGLSVADLKRKGKPGMIPAEAATARAAAALLLRQRDLSYDAVGRALNRTGGAVLRLLRTHLGSARLDDLLRRVQAVLDGDRVDGNAPYSWGLGPRWIRRNGGPTRARVAFGVDSTGLWDCTLTSERGQWRAESTHPLVALVHAYRRAQAAGRGVE